ncbi:MAG: Ig-like domain-containing protein, partial [Gemmatimonadetes bacterium]|nr:Ig-like domain-containing protein [Gemmatimonadota bacterium]NIT87277.1 Ig-like domain-containing protein [Gemmatimonadota bacterium]NIU31121.1 Ig-like domain-containing protein [Gemmatimonadota bacterium]NIV61483.1 hypothetical protein [Gemmatimonadota bacterium]NIW64186.1 hypothetical protein [Gemmatimonadota bacterium]
MRVSALVGIYGLGIALAVAAGCDGDEAESTTEIDSTPPRVVSMSPADGAAGIPTTSTVSATFSEPVDPSSVTTTSFSVVGVVGTVGVSDATATFTPDASLAPGTEYTATLTGAVTDLAGNSLPSSETWSFTTNATPAADAGADIDVGTGEEVSLRGSASDSDQDQTLTFTWTQVSGPDVGELSGQDPSFTAPDRVSTIEIDLTVSDGVDTSPADRVVVRVLEDPGNALWVSDAGGDDGDPGTRAEPLATIQAAVDAADAAGTGADVYVAAGTYPESVALADGVSVYGGFSQAWLRDIEVQETIVDGGSTAITGSGAGGLTLDGLTI